MHFICWLSAIFRLTNWPRKYTTRVDPHVNNSRQVWSWYDHTLPSYSVFVCRHVTWPCNLGLWSFDLQHMSCMGVTWPTLPPSVKTLQKDRKTLSVLELWVITFPVGYHWKCVCGYCACAESRDPWVGGQKQLHFFVCSTPIFLFTVQLRLHYDESS